MDEEAASYKIYCEYLLIDVKIRGKIIVGKQSYGRKTSKNKY
jgi:hypothetical protein